LIYNISDKPPFNKTILFAIQMVLSVFVATVLIANICGVSTSGALVGASLSTIVYLLITNMKSPMFLSNSGAFVAPVIFALTTGGYIGIAIGGLTSCVIYCLFGFIFSKISYEKIYNIFPTALIGAITVVIGINLMPFILTYVQINGITNMYGVIIALFTTLIIALVSHYSKGIFRILPFLITAILSQRLSTISIK
jgi:uracil permease